MALSIEQKRFAKFILTGGFAAIVNVVARIGFSTAIPYEVAVLAAYLVAMLTAYGLSRAYVFEASGRSVGEELTKFTLVNIVAAAQVWLVTMGLYHFVLPFFSWTFYPELVAHTIGVASPVFTSYLGHKYFTFRERSVTDKVPQGYDDANTQPRD